MLYGVGINIDWEIALETPTWTVRTDCIANWGKTILINLMNSIILAKQ